MGQNSDDRRPGDWVHRHNRTYDSANKIEKKPDEKKWYDQVFWIVFFLVIFWPVGVVLMFRTHWNIVIKILVCIALALLIYAVLAFPNAEVLVNSA